MSQVVVPLWVTLVEVSDIVKTPDGSRELRYRSAHKHMSLDPVTPSGWDNCQEFHYSTHASEPAALSISAPAGSLLVGRSPNRRLVFTVGDEGFIVDAETVCSYALKGKYGLSLVPAASEVEPAPETLKPFLDYQKRITWID